MGFVRSVVVSATSHDAAPAADVVNPLAQSVHIVDALAAAYDPTGHAEHALIPATFAYVPGAHASHASARVVATTYPGAQSTQLAWSGEGWYVPAAQCVHEDESAGDVGSA